MPIEVRPIRDDELAPWLEAASRVFFMWPWGEPQAVAEFRRPHMELDRARAAFDGSAIVGTYRTIPTQLTLPGGAALPASAVTAVSVLSTHRRRGILSAFQEDDVARAGAAGEPLGILLASEWPIYGRFGYGPATWKTNWTVRSRAARFDREPAGTFEVVSSARARELVPGIYERYAERQPGEIRRPAHRWDVELGVVQPPGRPKFRSVIVVHRDERGEPDGYAIYKGDEKWDEGIPDNVATVDELHGVSDEADLAMWWYLCSLDLVATLNVDTRRVLEPLTWHLADGRAARIKDVAEFMWVRIFDVPRALAARGYEVEERLVVEIEDQLGERGGPAAGRYELEAGPDGASCRRTRRSADLVLPARVLGAAYLGGTRLRDAVRSGGANEVTPGALGRADRLFRTADAPWCSTWF